MRCAATRCRAGWSTGRGCPSAIFTPATKADLGEHDENVDFEAVVKTVGAEDAEALRSLTLQVYARAEEIARDRGIIVADTKFEFGRRCRRPAQIVLADEVLTPDSSRFWPADLWEPGHAQPSFDKQYVRDWLTSPASGWDRHSGEAPPPLPEDVVEQTRAKYVEAYERLTGRSLVAVKDIPRASPTCSTTTPARSSRSRRSALTRHRSWFRVWFVADAAEAEHEAVPRTLQDLDLGRGVLLGVVASVLDGHGRVLAAVHDQRRDVDTGVGTLVQQRLELAHVIAHALERDRGNEVVAEVAADVRPQGWVRVVPVHLSWTQ